MGAARPTQSAPFRWPGRLFPRRTHDRCRHMRAVRPTKPQGSTAQISPQGVTRLTAVCQGAQEAAREATRTNKARHFVGLAVCTRDRHMSKGRHMGTARTAQARRSVGLAACTRDGRMIGAGTWETVRPTKAHHSVKLAVCTHDGRMIGAGIWETVRLTQSAPFCWAGRLYPRGRHPTTSVGGHNGTRMADPAGRRRLASSRPVQADARHGRKGYAYFRAS